MENTKIEQSISYKKKKFIAILLPVYLLQLCDGMSSALPAIILQHVKEKCSSVQFDISALYESLLASLDNGVSLLFCLSGIVGILQQKFGPLRMLQCGAVMSAASFIALFFSSLTLNSIWLLFISRILAGTARSCITSNVYLTEVLPCEIRGMFMIIESVSRGFGSILTFLLGYFINYSMFGPTFGWIPLLSFVWLMFASHESPVHLVRVNKDGKAIKALYRFKSTKESANKRFEEIAKNNKETMNTNILTRCGDSTVWKPFLIVTSLQIVQQFAMMTIFNKYIVAIFQDTFQANDDLQVDEDLCIKQFEPYLGAVFIGIIRLLAALTLSLMIDQHRRRSIYLVSGLLTALSLASFATCDYLITKMSYKSEFLPWLSVIFVCTSTLSANWGLQTIPNLLAAELFLPDVRPMQKSFSRGVQSCLMFCSLMVFPFVRDSIGICGSIFVCSGLLAIGVPSNFWYMPETTGMELSEIHQLFVPKDSNAMSVVKRSVTAFFNPQDMVTPTIWTIESDQKSGENVQKNSG